MIKKFISIKNVGRFDNYAVRGNVELQAFTLFFAENGRGKTTVGDILRSVQSGDGSYILGRRRLGATGAPEVTILTATGQIAFRGTAWTAALPDIAIFDSTFVHSNVFAGDYVDHDHRRNLYRVIVGEQGVTLSKAVDVLDAQSREAQKDLTSKKTALERHVPKGIAFDAFLALPGEADIEQKIQAKEESLAAAKATTAKATEIKTKGTFKSVTMPTLPTDFITVLGSSFDNVSTEAEQQVRLHLNNRTNAASDAWISQGLGFIREDNCPFCGQNLAGTDIVTHFKSFFDAAYRNLKSKLETMERSLDADFGEAGLLPVTRSFGDNATLVEFWKQFGVADIATPSIDTDIRPALERLREEAIALLQAKMSKPFEPVHVTASFTEATTGYGAVVQTVTDYNARLTAANHSIAEQKAKAATADPTKIAAELQQLKLVQTRHSPAVAQSVVDYNQATQTKTALEKQKEAAKQQLDTYSDTILASYEDRINKLLGMFGAGFRIGNTKRSYVGGKTSSTYHLLINNTPVELGDNSTPREKASFRNTLSAGDKSTLALVFFIAQIERDPNLSQKILVFDDPFTSQDRSRRVCTRQFICDLAKKSLQTLVLSHDPHFLRDLWGSAHGTIPKSLQLSRMGDGTNISEWDIENETRGDYEKTHRELWNFVHRGEGDPKSVARAIRPLFEKYLRLKLPNEFPDNEWLGELIKRIRNSAPTDAIAAAKVILDEVEAINDYSKRYHHNTNAQSESETVDSNELAAFVDRTLKLVGGF